MAEGAPLLREYAVYSRIEGSNPSLSVGCDPDPGAFPKPGFGVFPKVQGQGSGVWSVYLHPDR